MISMMALYMNMIMTAAMMALMLIKVLTFL